MGTHFKTRAHELLELAQKAGVAAAEVYQMRTQARIACFDANQLKQLEKRESIGLALRIWHQGKPGLAVAKGNVALSQVLEQAIALSTLNAPQSYELPKHKLCSPSLNRGQEVSSEQLIQWGQSAIDQIQETQAECACSAELSCESEDVYLINSAGLECGYIDTTLRSSLTAEWIRGHDFLCIEANQTTRDQLQLHPLIQRLQNNLKWSQTFVETPPSPVPILFTPNAAMVLWDTVQAALNGQKVMEEISPWTYQYQEQVLSPQLSLTQQPQIGPYSCPFDDEGHPSQTIDLVTHGQLNQYFTDQSTGEQLGLESTGNGFRPQLHHYPVPELINLLIAPGDQTFAALIAQMEDGLIVDQVLGETSRISGDISFNVDLGYRVQQGEIVGRVKDTLVSGNVYQALNQLMALGNDNQWADIYHSPSLLVEGLNLIASTG